MPVDPTLNEFEAAATEDGRERQLVNMAMELRRLSKAKYSSWRSSLQEKYDLTRGWWGMIEANPGATANDVPVNFLSSMMQSDIAKKQLVLYGERPYVQYMGSGQEDQLKARKRSALVERQFDVARIKEETARFFFIGNVYGKAVMRYHWRRDYGGYTTRERTMLGDRVVGKADPRTRMRGIKFDGPDAYVVDPVDWHPWPGVMNLRNMPGVGEDMYPDWEEIVAGSEQGPDGESPLYSPAAVRRARSAARANTDAESVMSERFDISANSPGDRYADMRTSWAKPVWVFEASMRVPRALGKIDPETGEFCQHLMITVLNGRELLRAVPIPMWDRQFPYVDWGPMVDGHYYYPPSKVETVMRLQAAINKWVSRGMDLLDLYVDPMILFDTNSGLDPDLLFAGTGVAVGVNGDVSEKAIRQLMPDLRGYNVTMDQVAMMWQWMQQILGMSADISLGAGEVGSDRQTAREWVGREAAINLRQRLELFLFEESALIPLFNAFSNMDRQWLSFPQEVAMIGSNAVYDFTTGQMAPPTKETVNLSDLEGDLDCYPLGITRQLSLQSRQGNVERVLPLLSPFLPALNMRAMIMQILPLYGMPNVVELTNTSEEMAQAMTLSMALEGQLPGYGGGGGTSGGSSPSAKPKGVRGAPTA